jgi:hypothetical protein
MVRICVLAIVLFTSGCTALANSPMVINQLKIRSAGFTGCATEDNEITNVNALADGSGTWNATCKDKVYLCSQARQVPQPTAAPSRSSREFGAHNLPKAV